jgi:hypothetical protein
MQPADSSLSRNKFTRRGGLETFFPKIVMIGTNLRVLEQKVNASDLLRRGYGVPSKLSDAHNFDLQLRKRSVAPTELTLSRAVTAHSPR